MSWPFLIACMINCMIGVVLIILHQLPDPPRHRGK